MRRYRLDSFRLLTLFLIVVGHIEFFGDLNNTGFIMRAIRPTVTMGARFAIPLFVIISGYFVGGKIAAQPAQAKALAIKYTRRLLVAFLFWSVVYAVEQPQHFLELWRDQPYLLLLEGTRLHLWYLMSLIITIWLFALWPLDKNASSFLIFGAVLYLIGLLGGAYAPTPIGFDLHIPARDGPFFTTLFFAVGVAFRRKLPAISMWQAAGIALLGLGLFVAEGLVLRQFWSVPITENDFLLGSVPYGIGVTLMAFKGTDNAFDRVIGRYGAYMLGIYTSHLLFLDLLKPLGANIQPLLWLGIYSILVFGAALLLSVGLGKTRLRSLVV